MTSHTHIPPTVYSHNKPGPAYECLPPQDHQSVMVKAATGGGGAEGGGRTTELLPIVFIVPKILPSALDRTCSDITGFFQYSLLGYGDAGVPGLLVALCLKFDITHRPASKCRLYFCVSSLGKRWGCGPNWYYILSLSLSSLLCRTGPHIPGPVPHEDSPACITLFSTHHPDFCGNLGSES